jgi:hypothetical protein
MSLNFVSDGLRFRSGVQKLGRRVNTEYNAVIVIGIDDLGTLFAGRSLYLHAVAGRIPPLHLPLPSSVLVLLYSDDQLIANHLRSDLLIIFRLILAE